MPATYNITEKDYVDAMRLHLRATRTATIVYVILVASLASLTVFGSDKIRSLAIGALITGVALLLLYNLLFVPMMAKRHYRKYKAIQEPITIKLQDAAIEFATPDSHSAFTWDKLLKWCQNEQYILIYPMPQMFFMIPKDISDQGFDLDALIKALRAHVGKEV